MNTIPLDPISASSCLTFCSPLLFATRRETSWVGTSPHRWGPPISRDKIERRKQTKGKTYTTAEVLVHIEKH